MILAFALLVGLSAHIVPWINSFALAKSVRTQQSLLTEILVYEKLVSSLDEATRAVMLSPGNRERAAERKKALERLQQQLSELVEAAPSGSTIPSAIIDLASHFRTELISRSDEVERFARAPGDWVLVRFKTDYATARKEHLQRLDGIATASRDLVLREFDAGQTRTLRSAGTFILICALWGAALALSAKRTAGADQAQSHIHSSHQPIAEPKANSHAHEPSHTHSPTMVEEPTGQALESKPAASIDTHSTTPSPAMPVEASHPSTQAAQELPEETPPTPASAKAELAPQPEVQVSAKSENRPPVADQPDLPDRTPDATPASSASLESEAASAEPMALGLTPDAGEQQGIEALLASVQSQGEATDISNASHPTSSESASSPAPYAVEEAPNLEVPSPAAAAPEAVPATPMPSKDELMKNAPEMTAEELMTRKPEGGTKAAAAPKATEPGATRAGPTPAPVSTEPPRTLRSSDLVQKEGEGGALDLSF